MKAVPTYPARQQPGVRTPGSIMTLLGVITLVTFIWLLKGAAPIAPGTYRPPVLDAVLLGTLTTRLETSDVQVTFSATGLSLEVGGELPILLVFEGAQGTSVYDLSDEANALSLHVLEGDQPYRRYSAFEGSVTFEDGGVHFSVRLEDEVGDPLWLSGRLVYANLHE